MLNIKYYKQKRCVNLNCFTDTFLSTIFALNLYYDFHKLFKCEGQLNHQEFQIKQTVCQYNKQADNLQDF